MLRQQNIKTWLQEILDTNKFDLSLASADASFRRYFRVHLKDKSYIVMDAPPAKEALEPFATLSSYFQKSGINTPKIYARDDKQGFLLLSDFGSTSYLDVLNDKNVDALYKNAIDTIVNLQNIDNKKINLPAYDESLLMAEMFLFKDWYLEKFTKVKLSKSQEKTILAVFEILAKTALSQPKACVHRDFHSRNLMYLKVNNPGVIDFQDAVFGPVTYDLVSLIKDCYINWSEDKLRKWLEYFYLRSKEHVKDLSLEEVEFYLDYMGVQRHLKASGIFARLYIRDGKPGYIKDIPRTLSYIQQMSNKYPKLKSLADFCIFNTESIIV